MIDDKHLLILAFSTPGRYLMGLSKVSADAYNADSMVTLYSPVHMTYMDDRITIQPISFMKVFLASMDAYAGMGDADKQAEDAYASWHQLRKNPPKFEVEEDVS